MPSRIIAGLPSSWVSGAIGAIPGAAVGPIGAIAEIPVEDDGVLKIVNAQQVIVGPTSANIADLTFDAAAIGQLQGLNKLECFLFVEIGATPPPAIAIQFTGSAFSVANSNAFYCYQDDAFNFGSGWQAMNTGAISTSRNFIPVPAAGNFVVFYVNGAVDFTSSAQFAVALSLTSGSINVEIGSYLKLQLVNA